MAVERQLLRHVLATLAYRTQKAVRGAPDDFADFQAGNRVRAPREIVRHMTSVLGYARSCLSDDGRPELEPRETWTGELERLHEMIGDVSRLLRDGAELRESSMEALLQGPISDAMTHAGQLALLRRLAGHPVEPENFADADIHPDVVGSDQPAPAKPGRRDGSGADPIR